MASNFLKSGINLSSGAIGRITSGHHEENVVVQVLGYKEIPGNQSTLFRLVLNDGDRLFSHAVLPSHLSYLIYGKHLERYTVICLKNYDLKRLEPGISVIVCSDIEIIADGSEINCKITNSKNLDSSEVKHVSAPKNKLKDQQASNHASTFRADVNASDTAGTCPEQHNASFCSIPGLNKEKATFVSTENNKFTNHASTSKTVDVENNFVHSGTTLINHGNTNNCPDKGLKEEFNVSSPTNCGNNKNLSHNASASKTVEVIQSLNNSGLNQNREASICKIADISPYYNKWLIKAFVYHKTPLNSYNNSRGSGKLFAFHLKDDSGEIRATAFNVVAEKIFESILLFKSYFISKATVKIARESAFYKGDFELIIEENTEILLAEEHQTTLLSSLFNFCTFQDIVFLPKDTYTDIIGICTDVSQPSEVITKQNKQAVRRNVILLDESGKSISVTLRNSDAKNHSFEKNEVVAIKNAKIIDYNGNTIRVEPASLVYIDPPIKETNSIKSWFKSLSPTTLSQISSQELPKSQVSQVWKMFSEIFADKSDIKWPIYYKTKATIVMVNREKCLYQACPAVGCMKKVIDNNGTYRCNKCCHDFDRFNWVLFLQLELADVTESCWSVAFQETAENLIGMSSSELSKIKDEDPEKFQGILNSLNLRSYIFDLRSYLEHFNDNVKLKTTIVNFNPIDVPHYIKVLLSGIKRYDRILNNT